MASTDRPDAIAPADADATDSLPAVANGDLETTAESESDRPKVPATSDDSGPIALGSASTHELLDPQTDGDNKSSSQPPETQLVSGDPLLRGPSPATSAPTPPPKPSKPSKPPPPPEPKRAERAPETAEPIEPSAPSTAIVSGVALAGTGQPARRAHVAPT